LQALLALERNYFPWADKITQSIKRAYVIAHVKIFVISFGTENHISLMRIRNRGKVTDWYSHPRRPMLDPDLTFWWDSRKTQYQNTSPNLKNILTQN